MCLRSKSKCQNMTSIMSCAANHLGYNATANCVERWGTAMQRTLTTIAFIFVLSLAFSAHAAPNSSVPYEFPVDFMVCNDTQLAALDAEVDALHDQASRTAPAHQLPNSQTLRRNIERQCNLPLVLGVPTALRTRPCVVGKYTDQIKKSAIISLPIRSRLRNRPTELNPADAYFTILGYHGTLNEAQEELARLKDDFPFEELALYPPHADAKGWAIVFSSYVDEQQADRARDLALALGMSPEPKVIRIPGPLQNAPDWLPATAAEPPRNAVLENTALHSNDLNLRVALWRRYAPLCTLQKTIWEQPAPNNPDLFPAKDDGPTPTPASEPCDDGDMTLFNGMLCAAGEVQGCTAVRNSEGDSHQWWRSPAIRAKGQDSADQPNLNSDQVLGLLLYVLQQDRRDDYRKWLEWVGSNGTPPRFCAINTNNCWFHPTDCPLLTVTAFALEVQNAALSLCPVSSIFGIPSPESYLPRFNDVVSAYQNALGAYGNVQQQVAHLQSILNISGVPASPVPPIPTMARFTAQLQKINDHLKKLFDLLQPPDPAGFAAAYFAASTVATANAAVAGAGQAAPNSAQARHLAATALFLLKKFRIPDPALSVAAAKLSDQQHDNPYFEFLARGANQQVRDLVMDECVYDPANKQPRFQWSWERAVSADAAKQTMLWDCIFMADLLQNGVIGMKTKVPGDPASFFPTISAELQDLKEAMGEMEQLIKTVLDVKLQVQDFVDALSQQLKYLQQLADAAVKGALPTIDGSKVSVPLAPLGTPGSPTVTVDVAHGHVSVSAGPIHIGF